MVYYLKFRPKSLPELYGQDHIVQTLKKTLEGGRLSHAYLFVGPRGVGKTSTARILAKMVNCPKGGEDNCDICQSIDDGSNMDLIEIDAASNRGIDDIRSLRDTIALAPSFLKKKVYIIDEAQMLTNEAFNALLKTLEEPPEHALFILATTDVTKIPQTILSRVTRLDFRLADTDALRGVFNKIAKEEKLELDDDALAILIKKAEGSFRDGVKLLDQLSAINKKITKTLVEENLRVGKFEPVVEILTKMSEGRIKEGILLCNRTIEEGISEKELVVCFLDLTRCLILLKYDILELVKNEYPTQLEDLKDLSDKFSLEALLKIARSFQVAFEQLKFASLPALPLEIAILEGAVVKTGDNQIRMEVRKKEDVGELDKATPSIKISGNPTSPDTAVLKDKWLYILEMIKPYNFSLEALLRQVKIHSATEGLVVLSVPYSFHQRILETPRNRDLLESVLSDVLARPTRIGCILEPREVAIEELANVEVAADDEVIKIAAEIFNS